MGKNFYISDLHFDHKNVIKFDSRPFFTLEEMNKTLINNWNSVVAKDDTVYILGDFCWSKEDRWIEIMKQLNGNKQLIKGNHCLKKMSPKLRAMFQDVKDYKEITDSGKHVCMSHFPMMFYKSAWNPDNYMLCGHVHTTRENDLLEQWTEMLRNTKTDSSYSYGNIINVGCMMPWMGYTPRTLDEILEAKGWK